MKKKTCRDFSFALKYFSSKKQSSARGGRRAIVVTLIKINIFIRELLRSHWKNCIMRQRRKIERRKMRESERTLTRLGLAHVFRAHLRLNIKLSSERRQCLPFVVFDGDDDDGSKEILQRSLARLGKRRGRLVSA